MERVEGISFLKDAILTLSGVVERPWFVFRDAVRALWNRVFFGKFNRAGKEGYSRNGGSIMGLSWNEF